MTSTASTSGAFRFVDGTLTEVERPAAPEPPPRGATPPHPGTRGPVPTELTAPELLLNRELTYLNFCWRVLHEAEDERVPLLERLKFVAIVSANIDEFFQKRIGGLKQQVGAGLTAVTPDGRSPTQQIAECLQMISDLERRKTALLDELRARLADHGVVIAAWRDLGADERAQVRAYYLDNIFPLVTPQAMDPAHPFPFVSNLSLNLLVTLHYPDDPEPLLARIKVPIGAGIPRFLQLGPTRFVPLDEVMVGNLDLLFPGMEVDSCARFRVTRNAITEREEGEADDLLELIEIELRERRFAPIVRLQVEKTMTAYLRGKLAAELGLDERDVFEAEGMLGQRDLMELAGLDVPALRDPPHAPGPPVDLLGERSIFHTIRDAGSVLVHHPYESFQQSVERFLREAASDPKVRAIKATLYRTSRDSQVIKHLIAAAQRGKEVTAVVELLARFDEEANINWAEKLERPAPTWCTAWSATRPTAKMAMVVRREACAANGKLKRRLPAISDLTGNYHARTARLYTDFGLLDLRPVPRFPGRGRDRSHRPRHLPVAARPARHLGAHPGGVGGRPLPRARPGPVLPQPRQARVLPGFGRPDAAQPRAPGRGPRADRRPAAPGRGASLPRRPARRSARRLGHDARRQLPPAPRRRRRPPRPAADDRAHRSPLEGRHAPAPPQGRRDRPPQDPLGR
jgi:polyphosphate kinase